METRICFKKLEKRIAVLSLFFVSVVIARSELLSVILSPTNDEILKEWSTIGNVEKDANGDIVMGEETSELISPDLDISSYNTPVCRLFLHNSWADNLRILGSTDGSSFEELSNNIGTARGDQNLYIPLKKNIKKIKLVGKTVLSGLKLKEDDIVNQYPAFFDVPAMRYTWLYSGIMNDMGESLYLNKNSFMTSMELDLSSLNAPYFVFSNYLSRRIQYPSVKLEISTDGIHYEEMVLPGIKPGRYNYPKTELPKSTKRVRVSGEQTIYYFLFKEKPVINHFPYKSTIEEFRGNWNIPSLESNSDSSIRLLVGDSIQTPELDLSALENPVLRLKMSLSGNVMAYASEDGKQYTQIGRFTQMAPEYQVALNKTTKYVVLKGSGNLYSATIKERDLIDSFPYEPDLNQLCSQWTFLPSGGSLHADRVSVFSYSGLLSPELKLEKTDRPYCYLEKRGDSTIYVSATSDMVNYEPVIELKGSSLQTNYEFPIPKTTKQLSLRGAGDYYSISIRNEVLKEDFPYRPALDDIVKEWTFTGRYKKYDTYISLIDGYLISPAFDLKKAEEMYLKISYYGSLSIDYSEDGINFMNSQVFSNSSSLETLTIPLDENCKKIRFKGEGSLGKSIYKIAVLPLTQSPVLDFPYAPSHREIDSVWFANKVTVNTDYLRFNDLLSGVKSPLLDLSNMRDPVCFVNVKNNPVQVSYYTDVSTSHSLALLSGSANMILPKEAKSVSLSGKCDLYGIRIFDNPVVNQFPYIPERKQFTDNWCVGGSVVFNDNLATLIADTSYIISPLLNLAQMSNPVCRICFNGNAFLEHSEDGIHFEKASQLISGDIHEYALSATTKKIRITGKGYLQSFKIINSIPVSSFPYIPTMTEIANGYEMSNVVLDGESLVFNNGVMLSPPLVLSSLDHPLLKIVMVGQTYGMFKIEGSYDGRTFQTLYDEIVDPTDDLIKLPLDRTIKKIRISSTSSTVTQLSVDEDLPISQFPYTPALEDIVDSWTLEDGIFKLTSGFLQISRNSGKWKLTSPRLDLNVVAQPELELRIDQENLTTYGSVLLQYSADAITFKPLVSALQKGHYFISLPPEATFIRLASDTEYGFMAIRIQQTSPDVSIQTLPYKADFTDKTDVPWFFTDSIVRTSVKESLSLNSVQTEIISPEIKIDPEISLLLSLTLNVPSDTELQIESSVNGADFVTVKKLDYSLAGNVSASIKLPAGTKYIKIKQGSNPQNVTVNSLYLQEDKAAVFDKFPLIESFEPSQTPKWEIRGNSCVEYISSTYDGNYSLRLRQNDTLLLKELNLGVLKEPAFRVMNYNYSSDIDVQVTSDFENYTTLTFNKYGIVDLPGETKGILLKSRTGASIWLDFLVVGEKKMLRNEALFCFDFKDALSQPYSELEWVYGSEGYRLKWGSVPQEGTEWKATLHTGALPNNGQCQIEVAGLSTEGVSLYFGSQILHNGVNSVGNFDRGRIVATVTQQDADLSQVCITRLSSVTPSSSMAKDITHFYDTDGDGLKEYFYSGSEMICFNRFHNGVPFLYESLPVDLWYNPVFKMGDFNGDGKIDFAYCNNSSKEWKSRIYLSNADGSYELHQNMPATIADFNMDGRKDFVDLEKYVNGEDPVDNRLAGWIQLAGGVWKQNDLYFYSQKMLENKREEILDSEEGGRSVLALDASTVLNSMKANWYIPPTTATLTYSQSNEVEIDLNKDGFTDLIMTKNGKILSCLGENKYLSMPLSGQFLVCDLNNDQISDFIHFDGGAKTVKTLVYNPAKKQFEEEVLMTGIKLDRQVFCYDFDRDGDLDILLPVSNSLEGGYSFLAIAENNGKGKFTAGEGLHEYAYKKCWAFFGCADVDNDGYYDLLIADEQHNSYVMKGKKGLSFGDPVLLPDLKISSDNTEGKLWARNVFVADFDADGRYEIMSQKDGRGPIKIYQFEEGAANQRPLPPAKPDFVYEAASGLLKVYWKPGSDTESSPCELTYSLRVGTTPGGGEIATGDALADGRRCNFLPGSLGSNLEKMYQTRLWGTGTYYISVQSVDPNMNGSAWSEPCVVEIKMPVVDFNCSLQEPTTADTLYLSAAEANGYEVNWLLADGVCVSRESDSQIGVCWSEPGEKRIAYQLVAGSDTLSKEKTIYVWPGRFRNEVSEIWETFDIDGDGDLDMLHPTHGVMVNDGKGNFEKVAKIYNADLTGKGPTGGVIDFNRNGLPDWIVATSKGNVMLNKGNQVFSILSDNQVPTTPYFLDLNNDGKPEGYYQGSSIFDRSGWYKNGDNGFEWTRFDFDDDGYTDFGYPSAIDLNRDGLWDFHKGGGRFLINKGDFVFELLSIPMPEQYARRDVKVIADFTNDGYPDLLMDNMMILENQQNKRFAEWLRIEIPVEIEYIRDMGIADLDNNGCLDIYHKDGIFYFYPDKTYRFKKHYLPNSYFSGECVYFDYNGDGSCDFVSNISPGMYEKSEYYYNTTAIRNEAPSAPKNLRVKQAVQTLELEWDDAEDDRTHFSQMRYNVSVRKKGMSGDNSFVISPLNGLKDAAAIIPGHKYYQTTRLTVPTLALPEGEYELQVQAIDGWNAHSPMSAPLSFSVTSAPMFELEEKICANVVTKIRYIGTQVAPDALSWNWNGGELIATDGNYFHVVWSEAGTKQVACQINEKKISLPVVVKEPARFYLEIPEYALYKSWFTLELPDVLLRPGMEMQWEYRRAGGSYSWNSLSAERLGYTNRVRMSIPAIGKQELRLTVDNGSCKPDIFVYEIELLNSIPQPKISLVTVDEQSGKYRIDWDANFWNFKDGVIPDYIKEVVIYRQGNRLSEYSEIGTASIRDGAFVDYGSYPELVNATYFISLRTKFGAESEFSIRHTPIRIQLNKLGESEWNISWSQYLGERIDYYRIWRGTSPGNLKEIAEVAGNYGAYRDTNNPGNEAYYAVSYERYLDDWKPMAANGKRRAANATDVLAKGRSFTVSTEESRELIMAQQLHLLAVDNRTELTPQVPTTSLLANMLPVNVTYKQVNWHIEQGKEWVTLTPNGVVAATGTGNGDVVIKATTIDGSQLAATINLRVSGYQTCTPLQKPQISVFEDRLETVSAEGITYQWYFNGSVLDQATASVLYPPYAGDYTLLVTNQCGESVMSDSYPFVPTGLSPAEESGLRVGPNPVERELVITSVFPMERMKLTNEQGKEMYACSLDQVLSVTISMQDFPAGVYFLQITGKDGKQTIRKILKKHAF